MRKLLLICLLGSLSISCSSTPKNGKEVSVAEKPSEADAAQMEDDFLKTEVKTEEVESAEKFDDEKTAKGTDEIGSSVSADLADASREIIGGNTERAIDILSGAVDEEKGGFLAAFNLGVLREHQGQNDKAANRYFQSLQKNSGFSPALENLVRLYLKGGRVTDAQRLVDRFTADRPEVLGHRAVGLQVQLYKGAYEDVIANAKANLKKDERHVPTMIALAEANYRLGRNELAKSIIETAVALRPETSELFYLAGLVELNLGSKSGAIANFKQAIALSEHFPEAHNNLGVLFHEVRDYASAEAEFKAAIRDFPDFKEAYLNLGNAYKGGKKYKDAEMAFKRALAMDEKYPDAHFNLGILYLDSDVPGMDAIPRLQKSVESLSRYKEVVVGMKKGDPIDKYIAEAKKAIEVEKQKLEMMREAPKENEEEDEEESGDGDTEENE